MVLSRILLQFPARYIIKIREWSLFIDWVYFKGGEEMHQRDYYEVLG